MRLNRPLKNHESGQSLVELGAIFMILMVLLGGIVDVSRLLLFSVSLRDAAQEGVHYASLKPSITTSSSDTSDIVNRARTAVGPTVTITVTYGSDGTKPAKDACSGDPVKVIVTEPAFKFIMPVIGVFIGANQISVSQSYSGTVLRPACP